MSWYYWAFAILFGVISLWGLVRTVKGIRFDDLKALDYTSEVYDEYDE